MNACTVIGEAPPRHNPFDRWGPSRARLGRTWLDQRARWDRELGGRCLSGARPTPDLCPEIPPYRPVVGLGELVTAADLWLHRVPDGTVGRVVWTGEIDGYAETVVAWADGRSTTHPAPLRMVRAHAAPEPWAAASLASADDPRWPLNPARRPKLERAP